ncbi:type II toxin-antitoxin system RelE family toxin [Corynebacterium aquatimens]|uniref:mRNA interferase RelE/StbE n=1 Tax=Corynebacterium aquatimens TaxID=1190508 RepID=A0A931E5C3_9CORY|nr:hypothetical protein [Corynebacterium aquatimens]MBG6122718.1 mRNA interferase RelE/StbE [Corynebacterium aquatimens]WJY66945.1 hypothetical protein CAQUA_11310 [Corynebacterium aquatimens]
MTNPERAARIRLLSEAVADVERLVRKDPSVGRAILLKMLLLERAPHAGEPLLGDLIGFRKLVVGNRNYRIVWREETDSRFQPVLTVAEVWAVGERENEHVYKVLRDRTDEIERRGNKDHVPLVEVVHQLDSFFSDIQALSEPEQITALPTWLRQALKDQLHLSDSEIDAMSQDEAQRRLADYWSQPR